MGETVAKRLVKHFGSLEAMMDASYEDLLAVDDIGEKIVKATKLFTNPNQRQMLQDLQGFGLSFEAATKQQASSIAEKTIVVSGVFERLSETN